MNIEINQKIKNALNRIAGISLIGYVIYKTIVYAFPFAGPSGYLAQIYHPILTGMVFGAIITVFPTVIGFICFYSKTLKITDIIKTCLKFVIGLVDKLCS